MDKKYCLGLYEKAMPGNLTMAEKLTAAREAGYDYLEMSGMRLTKSWPGWI